MPVFKFQNDNISFPPADFGDSDGLLAEGGEVNAKWLLEGYKNGFYLWTNPMRYPKWWTPDPRIVLFPKDLEVPDYVSEGIEEAGFSVSFNQDLEGVMKLIQSIENKEEMNSGWLTGKFLKAYLEIEKLKLSFSVEVHKNGVLVGGAFGASNGKIYFGEYINGTEKFAKECALIELTKKLQEENYVLLDLQKETNETIDIGLTEISRTEYIRILKQ
tara:strand:+ start:787 stop:1434 length:648 start_codon:yes stop_codon:yes gene_type:complete